MAKPTTFSASKLYVSLGDGASPETFAAPCGLTTRGFTLSKDTNDVTVPDCADPDAPAWTERAVRTLSGEFTGSGILAAEALSTWQAAFDDTSSRNARVGINAVAADNGGYYSGRFHLTNFGWSGDLGDKIKVSVTMVSDGELTWVDAT